MIAWKEYRIVPIVDTVRVADGYNNFCESCAEWGEKCEFCNVSVPLTSDYEIKEVTMAQMTICGIPVGIPYEVNKNEMS